VPFGGQVEDRETPETEGGFAGWIGPTPKIVGTPMHQRRRHPLGHGTAFCRVSRRPEYSCDPAHAEVLLATPTTNTETALCRRKTPQRKSRADDRSF
jgi:hypothetical protein